MSRSSFPDPVRRNWWVSRSSFIDFVRAFRGRLNSAYGGAAADECHCYAGENDNRCDYQAERQALLEEDYAAEPGDDRYGELGERRYRGADAAKGQIPEHVTQSRCKGAGDNCKNEPVERR